MNVYGPNNNNKAVQFYDHLIAVLRKEGLAYKDKIIIGGDFNCPINPLLDKQGEILVLRKKVVEHIDEIQTTFNFHDVWRVKNPQAKSSTWSQKSPFFCILDYWLISNSLQDLIKDVNIIAAIRTDHSAIFLHLQEIEKCQRGPGFWKMNTSLLPDENFGQKMKEKQDQWKKRERNFRM